MSAVPSPFSLADVGAVVDQEFLTKVAEILERLRAQSELRGHPLLASLIAIAKDEADDDLRTRSHTLGTDALAEEADDGVIRMAQRFSCGPREPDAEAAPGPGQLLAFIRA
jgi:hypothetical protein